MRALSLAAVTVGSILVLSPPFATAQQQNQDGLGGALDTLNRAINPDQDRDQRRAREDERYQRDQQYDRDSRMERGVSGSSTRDDRGAPSYRRYSDQDLRNELYRLDDEARQIDRERRAVEDEMSRRGVRR